MSIDVEDWCQSTFDRNAPITSRVYDNTMRLLELLARRKTTATFFVLGLVAEKFPRLIQEIYGQGHEIASHGYSHQPIFKQSRQEFTLDVQRSLELLESLTGCKILGYRAPDFSINSTTLWALEVLQELNLLYDSSIFPVHNPRYGIPDWPRPPLPVDGNGGKRLIEFPISTLRLGCVNIPFIGGGHTRLWPAWFIAWGIRRLHREGLPAMIYMHPYEINPDEFDALEVKIPFKQKFHQGLNRRTVYGKTERLLEKFRFGPIRDVLTVQKLLPDPSIMKDKTPTSDFQISLRPHRG
ncbi:MAG: DUF3473 domain-containing protein [candidate division KSB1 bacterium]|nr:DUF3473 domain-containing protein [candidate division KSB1 bacterium]MDZ7301662.1 DUF3473 domain-containing protein [candidate division KSB1 bacterium]MDZ7313477.1 DUF3473 domain-containing protein [candidate division KSB1 bacterium]